MAGGGLAALALVAPAAASAAPGGIKAADDARNRPVVHGRLAEQPAEDS